MTSSRPGYTLFELVITTAVIAITAAVAVPSLDGMYPSYKLNASVDAVRAAWALGRAHAIEEGRPYRFAVIPGAGKYRLAPDDATADGGPAGDNTAPSNGNFSINERLPQGVSFAFSQEESTAGQSPQQQQSQTASQQSADGMTTVAVFLPDGTASDDAEIHFQVKGAAPKSVKLRGLTGAVTVQQDGGASR